MDFSYRITPENGYLHAEVWGVDTKARTLEFFRAIIAGCASTGQPGVLLETRTENPLTTLDYYEIGQALRRMGLPRDHRIAAVTYTPQVVAGGRFLETVAVNRGIQGRLFPSREAALQWLLSP